ncbi:hypothetical protein HPB51_029386 [Rhipicephalus microplus]|uniref:Uncharacterized protein n=1 Tax=Rhipicephalus microplus TaxID=6941 RepID=A0A9J6CU49_RHIMP|nr:hypothetical protein HPB51_029386 [Rhipicephalus microplus]
MASGSLRSPRRHNVQYTKASSTSRSLRKSSSRSHKSTHAHQWTNDVKYQQYRYYDKQLRSERQTSIFIGGRTGVHCICLATSSAALTQSTPSSTTATTFHPTGGFCYETWSDEQCKMNKINSTFLCHCQSQASGTLNQAIQLAMNYPCEDVFPCNRHNTMDKMFWQKRAPTSWPGNLKCRCGDKSTERFIDISPKNNVADRYTSGRAFDGFNANQDLGRFKGTLLKDIAKISKNKEKINSAAITSVVRLHACINDFNILDLTFFLCLVFSSYNESLLLQDMSHVFYVNGSKKQCHHYDLPQKQPVVAPGRLDALKHQLNSTFSSFYRVTYASCKVIHSQVSAKFEASPATAVERFRSYIKTLHYFSLAKVANVLLVFCQFIVAFLHFFGIFVNKMVRFFFWANVKFTVASCFQYASWVFSASW